MRAASSQGAVACRGLFRIAFGVYFCVIFLRLLPWAAALYSDAGVLADPSMNPTASSLPSWLYAWATPDGARAVVAAGAAAAAGFALGWRTRLMAGAMWICWVLLWHRNVFTLNPSMPFNGFLMLAWMFIGGQSPEPLSLPRLLSADPAPARPIPADVMRIVWIVLAVGYSYSGLTKLLSPSWISGEALGLVLTGPLARPAPWVGWITEAPGLTVALTWGTLALEIAFAPLCLRRQTRRWAWLAMVAMHLGILITVQFAELTLGMLLIHLLTLHSALYEHADPHPRPRPLGHRAQRAAQ